MLTKCLGLLGTIPKSVEVIKERCENELIYVVNKTVNDVLQQQSSYSTSHGESSGETGETKPTINLFGDNEQTRSNFNNNAGESSSFGTGKLMNSITTRVKHLHPHQLRVLHCSSLLGYQYNGFSHLQSATSSSKPHQLHLPRSSQNLKHFFDMLILQYQTIVELHEHIVLPNMKRIEAAFDPNANHSTQFYTVAELWNKIQTMIQQLCDYYLDMNNHIGGINGGAAGGNTLGALINHHHFFSLSPGINGSSSSSSLMTKDYSSYFAKRKTLAATAMNAMTKNTMAVVASASNVAGSAANQLTSNQSSNQLTVNESANGPSTASTGSALSTGSGNESNLSTGASNVTSNYQRITNMAASSSLSLFKFEQSAQSMSWNAFLSEQHQKQLMEANKKLGDERTPSSPDDSKSSSCTSLNSIGTFASILSDSSSSYIVGTLPIMKLFESMKNISTPSLDNLVLIYGSLIKFMQTCPVDTGNGNQDNAVAPSSPNSSSLNSYLNQAACKFLQHVNNQLERMLESAAKCLDQGSIVYINHDSKSPTFGDGLANGSTFDAKTELHMMPVLPASNGILSASVTSSPAHHNQHAHIAEQGRHNQPLLEGTVMVDVFIHELWILMLTMPDHSNDYLSYICHVLDEFKKSCQSTYLTIVSPAQPEASSTQIGLSSSVSTMDLANSSGHSGYANTKRIISAMWTKDEDINRLLKSLPNWNSLQQYQKLTLEYFQNNSTETTRERSLSKMNQLFSFDESPDNVRQRNLRETEILASNLSNEIPQHELLWQSGQLGSLAHLQESFEWISIRCDDLVGTIQNKESSGGSDSIPSTDDVYLATLNQLSRDFAELADTCLLVLHLEVRVHCFYHLQVLNNNFFTTSAPNSHQNAQDNVGNLSLSHKPHHHPDIYSDDPKIVALLNDLKRMYTEMEQAQLKPHKMVYIFEGLGHLISTIFINSVAQMHKIKPNGIKRACRAIYDIQRRLVTITKNRELSLDYAREYFEMLLLSPDEILMQLVERGRQFTHGEYITAITLLHQSGLANTASNLILGEVPAGVAKAELEKHLKKLNQIFS